MGALSAMGPWLLHGKGPPLNRASTTLAGGSINNGRWERLASCRNHPIQLLLKIAVGGKPEPFEPDVSGGVHDIKFWDGRRLVRHLDGMTNHTVGHRRFSRTTNRLSALACLGFRRSNGGRTILLDDPRRLPSRAQRRFSDPADSLGKLVLAPGIEPGTS